MYRKDSSNSNLDVHWFDKVRTYQTWDIFSFLKTLGERKGPGTEIRSREGISLSSGGGGVKHNFVDWRRNLRNIEWRNNLRRICPNFITFVCNLPNETIFSRFCRPLEIHKGGRNPLHPLHPLFCRAWCALIFNGCNFLDDFKHLKRGHLFITSS